MSWLEDWWNAGGSSATSPRISGTNAILVKRDVLTAADNGVPLEVRMSVVRTTFRNWSATFTLETREASSPWRQQGQWTIDSTMGPLKSYRLGQASQAYDDAVAAFTDAERAFEGPTETVVRTEEHEGLTFTITRVDGGLEGTIFILGMSGAGVDRTWQFDTLAEAESTLAEQIRINTADSTTQTTREIDGVVVYRDSVAENNRSDVPKSITYYMRSETVPVDSNAVFGVGDMVGQFGPLDGDEEHDFGVFAQHIAVLNQPVDEGPTLEKRWVPVPFTGWEDAFSMANTPFGAGSQIEDSDVAGDVIQMEKNTGAFGFGDRYSSVALYIKTDYKVAIDVQANNLEKRGLGDQDVAFEAQLVGGDAFVLDFTTRDTPSILSVLLNGVESTPYTPEATEFEYVNASATIRLLNIYRLEEVPVGTPQEGGRLTPADDGGAITETGFANLGVLAIAGVVLLLFVGLLSRVGKKAVGGAEEATE